MIGDTFTCPGCGVSRPAEVVRAALCTPGVIACWMVPTSPIPVSAVGVAVAAAQAELRGEVRLPPHLRTAGCALLWCTVVEGRRVWAAEVEDLAELSEEGTRSFKIEAGICPWLTHPREGRLVVEGRAALPDGYPLPEEVEGLTATWRKAGTGDLWAFRLEGDGTVEDLWDLVQTRVLDGHLTRFDVLNYQAPGRMVAGELADNTEILLDEEGEPFAVSVISDVERDIADAEVSIKRTFGGAMEIGDWTRKGRQWTAPVKRWRPDEELVEEVAR